MPHFSASSSSELSVIAAESQITPTLDRTRPYARGLTSTLHPAPRKPGSASSLFAFSQFVYNKKWVMGMALLPCPSHWAGSSPGGLQSCGNASALPIPGNSCKEETKDNLLLAQHAILLVLWYKFRCGCPWIPLFRCRLCSLINSHPFLVSASPRHCTKFTSLSSCLSKSKCSQENVLSAVAVRLDLKY